MQGAALKQRRTSLDVFGRDMQGESQGQRSRITSLSSERKEAEHTKLVKVYEEQESIIEQVKIEYNVNSDTEHLSEKKIKKGKMSVARDRLQEFESIKLKWRDTQDKHVKRVAHRKQ